ncbi:neuroparsin-A [Tribolium castaneum]|uniref:Neuroparsin-like protein n=1 Tax=Tribolium castaneum TaxID=7070 RepID=D6WME2_TRICA|nr:PREDICTED: neuroparsin-A [Tribolium castaneum]XP_015836074.1 PREDICTED: neuroparsin-A [Tribolium castaneum]XP_015836075.1 PREDICTED: neuroparsin-A [Tribolium castaneum]XP_015836076.1 PREDICTED: neuroparsin-A [Tribolium castaneum]XP_015836077.1 PREDICTED: neuroparsin-A [Tribolium castaneum]EFA04588.2 neuroparsin-like protein [Tribolium castaneum]|eukprot:XP_008193973.1 PREDICTED: neuroparsin-A [Tribolium castaneum]
MCPFHNFITIILVLTVTVIIFSDKGTAMIHLPCKRCATIQECNADPPQLCVFGENRDYCNRRVCSKGPGEKCGDRFNILGTCGEGLWCSNKDNRCHGCYIPTMACYPDD